MGKIVKAVLMAVVVTALVIVTAGAIMAAVAPNAFGTMFIAGFTAGAAVPATLGGILSTIVGSAAFIGGLAIAGAGALVSSLLAPKMSGGMDGAAGNLGTKISGAGTAVARQIIYGKCRVGGTFAHIETTGNDGAFLNLIIVVSGHPVEGFEKVFYNDLELTTATQTEQGETVYYATQNDLRDLTGENKSTFTYSGSSSYLVRFTFHDGTQTACDGLAQNQLGAVAIPNTHKYTNCAYFFFQCAIDSEKNFAMPKISFLMKGKNIIDPRTNAAATTDAQRSNPALILHDYLTDTTYGLKAKSDEVNTTTNAGGISAAANICDQQVTLGDGSTQQTRYTCNGFTNMQATGESVIQGILGAMAGKMTFTNGKFQTFAGAAQTPEFTITDADALGPFEIVTKKRGGDMYNQIKAVFPDSGQKFTSTETPVFKSASMLLEDTPVGDRVGGAGSPNFSKEMEISLGFTTDTDTAQRIQKIQLLDQRQTTRVAVRVPMKYIQCQPNDWIYITNSRLGFSSKLFQIEDMSMELDTADNGSGALATVSLSMRETDAAVFSFAQSDYTTPVAEGNERTTGVMTITAPTIGTPSVASVVDGPTVKINITVNWTNANSDDITGTEVQYKLSGGTYLSAGIAGKAQSNLVVADLTNNQAYVFRVRHQGKGGIVSAFSSEATITPSHTDTFNAPSGLAVVNNKPLALSISWTNPTNTNLRSIKVYESSSSIGSSPSESLVVATLTGEPNKKMVITRGDTNGLTAGTTYYYKVRGVTHTGQESALSSQVSGAFTGVNSSVIDFPVAGFFHLDVAGNTNAPTDSAFNTAFGRLPMDEDFVIVQNTSASPRVSQSYKYGSANSGGGGGSFSEVTEVFTGDQVVNGTLGATKIVAGSLSSASGVFGVISANDISTGSLKADYISIDGVTLDTTGSAGSKSLIIKQAGVAATQLGNNAATWAVGSSIAASSSVNTTHRTDTQQYIASPALTVTTSADSSLRPTVTYVEANLNFLANTGSAQGTVRIGIHQSTTAKSVGTLIGSSSVTNAQATSVTAGFSVSLSTAATFTNTSSAQTYYYYITWVSAGSDTAISYRRGTGSMNAIARQR